jgi:hypothetical protein
MIQRKNISMSVDALLEVVRQRGLHLANLFQIPDTDRWQANVSNGHSYWEFGRGGSADEALMAALHMAATTEPEYSPPDPPVRYIGPREPGSRAPLVKI